MRFLKKYPGYFFLLFFCAYSIACASQQPVKVACIGNSVTFGLTHKNPQLTSYPSQLQKLLGGEIPRKKFWS